MKIQALSPILKGRIMEIIIISRDSSGMFCIFFFFHRPPMQVAAYSYRINGSRIIIAKLNTKIKIFEGLLKILVWIAVLQFKSSKPLIVPFFNNIFYFFAGTSGSEIKFANKYRRYPVSRVGHDPPPSSVQYSIKSVHRTDQKAKHFLYLAGKPGLTVIDYKVG